MFGKLFFQKIKKEKKNSFRETRKYLDEIFYFFFKNNIFIFIKITDLKFY